MRVTYSASSLTRVIYRAMLADQQSILPKVINGLKTKEQTQMHKILGSVLQLALLKGVELNEKDQEYFKTMCNTAPPDLVHLCMSFR